jgi:hypothetical protein
VALAVRTRSDPLRFAERLRAVARSLDPALPLHAVFTLDEARRRSAWAARMGGQLLSQVAVLALVLTALVASGGPGGAGHARRPGGGPARRVTGTEPGSPGERSIGRGTPVARA